MLILFLFVPIVVGSTSCSGSYKSPAGCSSILNPTNDGNAKCNYEAEWTAAGNLLSVKVAQAFTNAADWATDQKRWMGIGWNKKRAMGGGEAVLLSATRNGMTQNEASGQEVKQYTLNGESSAEQLASPTFTVGSKSAADGVVRMEFTRALDSGPINMTTDCVHFLFPIGGGSVSGYSVGVHSKNPAIRAEFNCFATCAAKQEGLSGTTCAGKFKYSSKGMECQEMGGLGTAEPCDYAANWFKDGETILFQVASRVPNLPWNSNGFWTGIGFNPKPQMDQTHAVILSIASRSDYDNNVMEATQYSISGFGAPNPVTGDLNIGAITNTLAENGQVRFNFTWNLAKAAYDLDSNCVRFIFPTSGGRIASGKMQQHTSKPIVSSAVFCLSNCTDPTNPDGNRGRDEAESSARDSTPTFLLFATLIICTLMF